MKTFQRVGAFKFRGAYHALSRLSPRGEGGRCDHPFQRQSCTGCGSGRQIAGHSSRDCHAGGRTAGQAAGDRRLWRNDRSLPGYRSRERHVRVDRRHGYTLIHPYDNHDIILGQGTAAAELFDEVGSLDLLFTPVGGGGLLSGSALAAAALSPDCRVIGVEPAMAADANQSWRENQSCDA